MDGDIVARLLDLGAREGLVETFDLLQAESVWLNLFEIIEEMRQSLLAETGRLDALSDGVCRSNHVAALKARLGPYVTAGLRGLARRTK